MWWLKNRNTRPFNRQLLGEASNLVAHFTISAYERTSLNSQILSLYKPGGNGIAVHGDIHRNNVLWKMGEDAVLAAIVDFDDCYNGCIADELYSFMRGYCYVGASLDRARISHVSNEFHLVWCERDILYRLAAECVYFYFAILDSYTKKRGARKEDLDKELRKIRTAIELARIVD
ncbi:MAG: phosphotransferase [Gammaproteobacteria bacterium]